MEGQHFIECKCVFEQETEFISDRTDELISAGPRPNWDSGHFKTTPITK